MKNILIGFILYFDIIALKAQIVLDSNILRPTNNIYLNLLGAVTLVSIDYEKLIPLTKKFILSNKLGIGYNRYAGECPLPSNSTCPRFFVVPHHFTANLGKKQNFFEIGLGGTIVVGELQWQGRPKHYFFISHNRISGTATEIEKNDF